MPSRVVVVGGGITGLATCYFLERRTDAPITLIEAAERVGGKISTERVDGLTVEAGPDCFFSRKSGARELAEELGLQSRLIEPREKGFSLLIGGKLLRVPLGMVSFNSIDPQAVADAEFLSYPAKARVMAEWEAPAGKDDDESIASFFRRRFGEEFSRLVAEPILAGTHSGDPEHLSLRALYPNYFDWERQYGSLSAARMQSPAPSGAGFLSFAGGMGELTEAIAGRLERTQVRTGSAVLGLNGSSPYTVVAADGPVEADHVVLALPSNRASGLLEDIAPEAARLAGTIEHSSSTIVTVALPRRDVGTLSGTGFLAPRGEHPYVTGATWSSLKWADRAPEGMLLVRVFLGNEAPSDDDAAIRVAVESIAPLIEARGAPSFCRVRRWSDALPQYRVGHLGLMEDLEQSLAGHPGIHLAGTSYRGVGIPDCIRQARETAERVAAELT